MLHFRPKKDEDVVPAVGVEWLLVVLLLLL